MGDDHSRDASFGAVKSAIDLSKEEDEDDNALLLSVARAFYNTDSISFGVSKVSDRSSFGASKSKPAYDDNNNDDEEGDDDDDDDILRSVEKIYGGLDLTKATGLSLPNLDKVHQDGNQEVYGGPGIKSAVAGPKVGSAANGTSLQGLTSSLLRPKFNLCLLIPIFDSYLSHGSKFSVFVIFGVLNSHF